MDASVEPNLSTEEYIVIKKVCSRLSKSRTDYTYLDNLIGAFKIHGVSADPENTDFIAFMVLLPMSSWEQDLKLEYNELNSWEVIFKLSELIKWMQ